MTQDEEQSEQYLLNGFNMQRWQGAPRNDIKYHTIYDMIDDIKDDIKMLNSTPDWVSCCQTQHFCLMLDINGPDVFRL